MARSWTRVVTRLAAAVAAGRPGAPSRGEAPGAQRPSGRQLQSLSVVTARPPAPDPAPGVLLEHRRPHGCGLAPLTFALMASLVYRPDGRAVPASAPWGTGALDGHADGAGLG